MKRGGELALLLGVSPGTPVLELGTVPGDLSRLPQPDGSVGAIVLDLDTFALERAALPAAVAEWRRVLAPGGTLCLGFSNGLYRLPGFSGLRQRLRARSHPESRHRRPRPLLRPSAALRELDRAGFGRPAIWAPLPDQHDAEVLLAVAEPAVVRYFFKNLVRQHSPLVRAAVGLARALHALGLLDRIFPYRYLVFRPDRP